MVAAARSNSSWLQRKSRYGVAGRRVTVTLLAVKMRASKQADRLFVLMADGGKEFRRIFSIFST